MSRATRNKPRIGVVKYAPDVYLGVAWWQRPRTEAPDVALLAGTEAVALQSLTADGAQRGITEFARSDAAASAVARELRKCFRTVVRWEGLVAWIHAPAPPKRRERPIVGVCCVRNGWRWAAWDASKARKPIAFGIAHTRENAVLELVVWLLAHGETWERALKDDARAERFFASKQTQSKRPAARPRSVPDLCALGLRWPASVSDIKKAFRSAALSTHPDRGGNAKDFIAARTAYEAGMRAHGGAK